MPRLLFLRHAKAERTQPGSTDHDRALTKSGRNDSVAMGPTVAKHGPVDLVLCSTARRASETWDLVGPALRAAPELRLLRAIYEADDYLPILNAEGGEAATVLLVGHNPTMHETALALISNPDSAAGAVLASRFPKAALAVMEFEGSWATLAPRRARLSAFVLPERD